ncbi:NUDIX hydrolase [Microvirga sp. VF16]|uniref:NUDIX hydrolase n=1 Tax=Microvirga sp. VF16 TaxID=2807101 RepID=UPI00193D2912|nr:NUDIX domain-containing protein [Microvirga sp. VF16]QRM34750.1 NUDIX domain-containing protein [Microvirga sp. VF16]
MRRRPSARLLVLDPTGRVLLFRFSYQRGALVGQSYWATPGGGLEEGETFEQAAIRELREETGLHVDAMGPEVESREFVLQLPDGEHVMAHERFFVVQTEHTDLSRNGWTSEEHEVMADHRWWSISELAQTSETIWPDNLPDILSRIEVPAPAGRTVSSNRVP